LTSNETSQTLEPGYYEQITVTTNAASLASSISYIHHIHSTTESDKTYLSSSFATDYNESVSTITYAGYETVASKGGCFDVPVYHTKGTKTEYCGGSWQLTSTGGVLANGLTEGYIRCSRCGETGRIEFSGGFVSSTHGQRTYSYDYWTATKPASYTEVRYGCKYKNGESIGATITY
jgi:hypothetical protein